MLKREFDIYVPTEYNDGMPIELGKLESIKDRVLAKFDGVSVSSEPVEGYWKGPDGAVCRDRNYVYKVIADDSQHVWAMIVELKRYLEEALKQEQIFVIVRNVEVM